MGDSYREEEGSLSKFFEVLSYPFAIDTGLYLNNKKYYSLKSCGIISMISFITLLVSFVSLFGPLISGNIIDTKLETNAFTAPGNMLDESPTPTYLRLFFGFKKQEKRPVLNIGRFTD